MAGSQVTSFAHPNRERRGSCATLRWRASNWHPQPELQQTRIAILWGSYRVHTKAPLSPEIRKKNTKLPHPRLGPENTKKIPKKYEIPQKFSFFIRGPTRSGRFCIFVFFFFAFSFFGVSGLEGFLYSARTPQTLEGLGVTRGSLL